MKKILPFLVVGILALGGLGAVGLADNAKENDIQIIGDEGDASFIYEDELDQEQLDQSEGYGIPVGTIHIPEDTNLYIQVAQSFIPTKEILTRVELLVGKNATASHPYVLAIREELTEENIVEISLNPEEFVIENYTWLEFDFEDIWVTVGQTYYIVCYTENVTDNWYAWAANNDSESYPYGCAWVSINGDTWTNDSIPSSNEEAWTPDNNGVALLNNDDNASDMCFKTYGIEATELGIELTSTGFGVSAVITNIGDAIAWELEWTMTIQGGILGLVNKTISGTMPELGVNESITVSSGIMLMFGFGPITITATAKALNAPEVSDSIDGFIIFIFIIIP